MTVTLAGSCLLGSRIWFSPWTSHHKKGCCWMLLNHHLLASARCEIWFSWSVAWCCLGCRHLPDLPAMLIHIHQWLALSLQGAHHFCSAWWWFDLLLMMPWKGDWLLFSLILASLMSRILWHLLMLSQLCCKFFLDSQVGLWDVSLGSLFLTNALTSDWDFVAKPWILTN